MHPENPIDRNTFPINVDNDVFLICLTFISPPGSWNILIEIVCDVTQRTL